MAADVLDLTVSCFRVTPQIVACSNSYCLSQILNLM